MGPGRLLQKKLNTQLLMKNDFMTMKRIFLFLICAVLLLTACRQQQPVSQLKEINEALEKADLIIEDNNKVAYE